MKTPPFLRTLKMKKAYFFVVLTAFLFGTMEVACKAAGNQLDPFQLTFLRFAIGGLILLPFAAAELKQNRIKLTAKDILILAGVGALGIPLSMVFFQLGVMNSNAATASVLICINPFFTMVFAHFFTEEKLNRNKFIVLALGLAQTSISFILGSLILFIIILITGKPVVAGVTGSFILVLYVGIFVTGLGYYSYFMAIKNSDAATGSLAFFLKPAIAPVMAVIFLKETILWNTYIGIGLILAASYMNIRYQRKNNEIRQQLDS